MKEFQIEYRTENLYDEDVKEAMFEVLATPCNDSSQTVVHCLQKNSFNQDSFNYRNFFGFEVSQLRINKEFRKFTYNISCRVIKNEVKINGEKLDPGKLSELIDSDNFFIENHIYLTSSHLTALNSDQRSLVPVFNRKKSLLQFLTDLTDFVNKRLKYARKATSVDTTASEALDKGTGVCQDYAHVFISMARFNKIPCRYVSGYLNQGLPDSFGSDKMHAWSEALIPGCGWIGFDPTNNCLVTDNYIKVAHGADYSDCSPFKGVLKTNGENITLYSVKVEAQ